MATCKTCGAELAENAKFCPKCGSKIEPKHFCSSCGAELLPNVKFCPKCGTNQNEKSQPAASQTVVQNKDPIQQNSKSVETESISTKENVHSLLPNLFLILFIIGDFCYFSRDGGLLLMGHDLFKESIPLFFLFIVSELCAALIFVLSLIELIQKKNKFLRLIAISKCVGLLSFVLISILLALGIYWVGDLETGFLLCITGWLLSSIRIPTSKK